LFACTGHDDSATTETPTVEILSPTEGESVATGDVALSIAVNHFLLSDPAKHNAGEPEGYLHVSWTDGTTSDELDTGSTTPSITIGTAGDWTVTADLRFADGDGMDEEFSDFAPATVGIVVVDAR
jgi:hypothetical protein